jgi:hypothetical protein
MLQMWLNFCFSIQLSKALVPLLDLAVSLLDLVDPPLVLALRDEVFNTLGVIG